MENYSDENGIEVNDKGGYIEDITNEDICNAISGYTSTTSSTISNTSSETTTTNRSTNESATTKVTYEEETTTTNYMIDHAYETVFLSFSKKIQRQIVEEI